jgi:hypothetical protein
MKNKIVKYKAIAIGGLTIEFYHDEDLLYRLTKHGPLPTSISKDNLVVFTDKLISIEKLEGVEDDRKEV